MVLEQRVVDDACNRATRSWRSNQNHGRELMPAIVDSLAELSLKATDITHVAVATGPGGFSAVRVGISAALGLAVSRQLPVLGIPTHSVEVEPFAADITDQSPVYSLIPAGRNEISWTRHTSNSGSGEPTIGIAAPDELAAQLEANAFVCGEACDLMAGLIDQSRFRGKAAPTRDASSILDIAVREFDAGNSTPYEELRPIYARPPSISKPKPAK